MSRSITVAGATALALALVASSAVMAQEGEPADPITSASGVVSDTLIPQDGALVVYEEHIRVLNACDWLGLVARYPNNAELHFINNSVTVGREAIGGLFDGFVAPFPAGLLGLTFTEELASRPVGPRWCSGSRTRNPWLGPTSDPTPM